MVSHDMVSGNTQLSHHPVELMIMHQSVIHNVSQIDVKGGLFPQHGGDNFIPIEVDFPRDPGLGVSDYNGLEIFGLR